MWFSRQGLGGSQSVVGFEVLGLDLFGSLNDLWLKDIVWNCDQLICRDTPEGLFKHIINHNT